MLTPEWYNSCSEQIMLMYQRLEDAILRDIIRRFMKTGIITETAKWQAEMLQEAGMLYNDIVREIAKHSEQSEELVRSLFREAGVETVRANNPVYEESEEHSEIDLSDSMKQILDAQYRVTMGNIQNLTNTTAVTSQAAYITACNEAQMKVTSGAFSYQEAVRQAVRLFSGGVFVSYPSGHRDRIDVAIARAVRTGIGQASAEIGRENAKELDTDLMEIDAHSGARPSHAVWQGKLVSLSGKNAGRVVDGIRVLSLDDIGYGTGGGFRGWNCRHDWYPYIEGLSSPMYTEEQLLALDEKSIEWNGKLYTEYEISQMQRNAERKIRALKRELVCYDAAGDKEAFSAASVKLKTAERQLKDFLNATGRDRENWREQVNGFGRSQSSKAVWAEKKAAAGLTLTSESDIIKPYEIKLSRADKKRIINRGIAEEKPIFAIDTDTNKFASYVRNVPPKDGFYDVALHGAPTYAEFFGEKIDAYTLAKILRNRNDYSQGTKIRLLSCNTGNIENTGNCFAQLIADEMGVEVEAPTKIIWVSKDGSFSIGDCEFSNDGEMKTFYSRR